MNAGTISHSYPFRVLLCLAVVSIVVSGCVSSDGRQHRRELKALADQTTGRSNTCQVHHTAMTIKTVEMAYGLIMFTSPQPTSEVRQHRFPYAAEDVLAGCVVSDTYPKTASVYHCPDCLRAQSAWYAAHPKTK